MIRKISTMLALGLLLLGCAPKTVQKPAELPSIIILTVENLSADQLNGRPNLDALRKRSVQFEHAYLLGPTKGPNLAALTSGRMPAGFNYTIDGRCMANPSAAQGLDEMMTTIPELLMAGDYRTAFWGTWAIGKDSLFPTYHGYDEDSYNSQFRVADQDVETHTDQALDVFPPFGNYINPQKLQEQSQDFMWRLEGRKFMMHFNLESASCQGEEARVGALDNLVGMLTNALDTMHRLQNTIIILTSTQIDVSKLAAPDQARMLSEAQLKVPFWISWPAVATKGKQSQWRVSLSDVLPTLADIFEMPGVHADGSSLLPLLLRQDTGFVRRPFVFHYPYSTKGAVACGGMLVGNQKIIEYLDGSHLEYFDLAKDPNEEHNLVRSHISEVLELMEQLSYNRKVLGIDMLKAIQ